MNNSGQKSLISIIHNIQSGIYIAENKINDAKESLTMAIEANSNNLKSYETLAKLYLLEKNKEKAIEQYKTIVKKNSHLPAPHMMLGSIYDADKNFDSAADHYKKALEINPEFAAAANNLAYHYLKRTDKLDEGFRLASLAKSKLPEEPAIMDTMGMAYFSKGLYGNAANEFLDSLTKIPNNPIVNYHLAQAYLKKGEKSLAIASLKKALELSDNFEDVAEVKKILAELEN